MILKKTSTFRKLALIALLYVDTSLALPRVPNFILSKDVLVNSSNEELVGKRLIIKEFDFNIIIIKHVNSLHDEYEIGPSLKKKYVNWGFFNETSLLIMLKNSKIYFTNFDLALEVSRAGNIETNGLYEYDFLSKNLKKLTTEKQGEISFYRITKFENGNLYYQRVSVKKDDAHFKSQHLYTGKYDEYFKDIYSKLVNTTSLEKIQID